MNSTFNSPVFNVAVYDGYVTIHVFAPPLAINARSFKPFIIDFRHLKPLLADVKSLRSAVVNNKVLVFTFEDVRILDPLIEHTLSIQVD